MTVLVVFSRLTAEHANPTGLARRFQLQSLTPLARGTATIYAVNGKPGLPVGATIKDRAGQFPDPVLVHGISTRSSIAQQFAIDHPQLVRRLMLAATACRLSPHGREVQRRYAELVRRTPSTPAPSCTASPPRPWWSPAAETGTTGRNFPADRRAHPQRPPAPIPGQGPRQHADP